MDGAEVVASLVKFSSHLEELFIDDNLIGNEGVEFLAEAVVCCRTLRLLSLSHNNISEPGIEALCHSLVHNMALKDLRLLHNPLGPDGVKHIGELLARNKCLTSLDISDVDLMREESNLGIQAINFGLTRNRQLRHLKMRSNKIDDQVGDPSPSCLLITHITILSSPRLFITPSSHHPLYPQSCGQLAFALLDNKGLIELDLSFNILRDRWFKGRRDPKKLRGPEKLIAEAENKITFVRTRQMGQLISVPKRLAQALTGEKDNVFSNVPSIELSLQRNRKALKDPTCAHWYKEVWAEMEEGFEGTWKSGYSNKWEALDKVNQAKASRLLKAAAEEECERMSREEEYVRQGLERELDKLEIFLDSDTGAAYARGVAKLLLTHMKRLPLIKSSHLPPVELEAAMGKISGQSIHTPKKAGWFMNKSKAVIATEGKIDHFPAPPGSPLEPLRVMTALAARPDTPLASKAISDAGKV